MIKRVYYFFIVYYSFLACYHCYVGDNIKLISDAVMFIGSFICLEIKKNKDGSN